MDAPTLAAAAQIPLERAEHWQPYIEQAVYEFGIDTPRQRAAFIAQCSIETSGLQRWIESLNYSTAERIYDFFRSRFASVDEARPYVRSPVRLANRVYANREGNGDEESGDGFLFRGRGLIQTTFRNNYRAFGLAIGVDVESSPELLERQDYAALSAGFYWQRHNLNDYADVDQINAISGVINRGSPYKRAAHQDERAAAYGVALAVLA